METGTKQSKSANKYIKGRPVLFNSWPQDYYSLGVFCAKTNMVNDARKAMRCLREATEESRLFVRGVNSAHEFSIGDLAFEISQLRALTGSKFDAAVYERAGFRVLSEIKGAIADAHDWETERQRQVAHEMLTQVNQPRLMEAMA